MESVIIEKLGISVTTIPSVIYRESYAFTRLITKPQAYPARNIGLVSLIPDSGSHSQFVTALEGIIKNRNWPSRETR